MRGATALGTVCLLAAAFAVGCDRPAPPPEPADWIELDVGLTAEERADLRFLSEGSDLFPVHLLLALDDTSSGKPFAESLDRYGFLPSPKSDSNPYGLPVGWTTDVPDLSPNRLPYVGLNCAACHTGQIDYRGQSMRIDGAPNLADIEAFGLALRDSLLATLADPARTLELMNRLSRALHPEAGIAAPLLVPRDTRKFLDNLERSVEGGDRESSTTARELGQAIQRLLTETGGTPREEARRVTGGAAGGERQLHIATALEVFARYGPIVRNRLEFGLRGLRAIEISPVAGPGRDDPWGIIRNLVFASETPMTAPTSIPHLFHYRDFDWYHADGNTTSVMQRNVAQAVALGAYVDDRTRESTLRPRNIHRLEELWSKVTAPAWPSQVFGPVDAERAARGRAIFERPLPGPDGVARSCADCHGSRRTLLVDLDIVGTDPNRALSFAEPIDGEPFDDRVVAAVGAIMETSFARAGVDAATAASWEYRQPEWRTTRRYVARRLDGVWATAPYLHNGSVPTLADLLLPPAARPDSFALGHREYDPETVGYSDQAVGPGFVFDTSVDGNSNAGHEFGTALGAGERADLVEYLKTL